MSEESRAPDASPGDQEGASGDEETRRRRETEARLYDLIDGAPVALFFLDAEGRYTCAEGQRFRSLGVRTADLLGHLATELNGGDAAAEAAVRRALRGARVTFRGQSRAGGTFECQLIPKLGDDGSVLSVAGLSYDATEQNEADEALRLSEERLRLALTAGRQVALEIDFESDTCVVSENAREVLGAGPEQLTTLSAAMSIMHPDDLPTARRSLAHAMEHGVPVPDIQYRVVRPDNGEVVWFERRVTFLRDATGKVTGLRGIIIDISQRKRAEEIDARARELEMQHRRMQQASRMKSEFLANMSHELRTPLNAIIGFAELLHDGQVDASSPRHREFLGDILGSGRHLLRLINDVLDLAKVEAGKQEFFPEDISLAEVFQEVQSTLQAMAQQKRIRVDIELDENVHNVFLDPARLKQVLFNYLSNALKFTPEGGRVVLRTAAVGELAFRIEVEDNGIGIAPQDLGRLFKEFQQLETGTNKRHQGTGLGLALTRRLVEAQGGTVGVSSRPGLGSTFVATLPRNPGLGSASARAPATASEHPDGVPVVLIVEDELGDQQQIERILRSAGYAVELARDGLSALRLCQLRKFDAVTLDLLLPDMNGLELLAGIRASGLNVDVPVVVVTVLSDHSVVASFRVHDALHKPLDAERLLGSLRRAGLRAPGTSEEPRGS